MDTNLVDIESLRPLFLDLCFHPRYQVLKDQTQNLGKSVQQMLKNNSGNVYPELLPHQKAVDCELSGASQVQYRRKCFGPMFLVFSNITLDHTPKAAHCQIKGYRTGPPLFFGVAYGTICLQDCLGSSAQLTCALFLC